MKRWFEMKYLDDVSDIRPEQYGYYKYHVHHFVNTFFTAEKVTGKEVLDLGCGPGFYALLLAGRGAKVKGIDQEEYLIGKAKQAQAARGLTNVKFTCGEFASCSLKWPYAKFDYILAIDVVVSFDYLRARHAHEDVVRTFQRVRRLLKDEGRFYVIESHPFFGRALNEAISGTGDRFCVREAGYKFEHRREGDPNHWFTLAEMTRASCESGLAISRIYEPEPDPAMKDKGPEEFEFRVRYPGMIVYEMCKMMGV